MRLARPLVVVALVALAGCSSGPTIKTELTDAEMDAFVRATVEARLAAHGEQWSPAGIDDWAAGIDASARASMLANAVDVCEQLAEDPTMTARVLRGAQDLAREDPFGPASVLAHMRTEVAHVCPDLTDELAVAE